MKWLVTLLVASVLPCCGCNRDLHGRSEPSKDGKTYLVVDDAPMECRLIVDGRTWSPPIHAPGPIAPGTHSIQCVEPGSKDPDASSGFTVRPGMTLHYDYWGP